MQPIIKKFINDCQITIVIVSGLRQGDGETTAAGVGKAEESGVANPAAKRAGNCSQDEGQESELEH